MLQNSIYIVGKNNKKNDPILLLNIIGIPFYARKSPLLRDLSINSQETLDFSQNFLKNKKITKTSEISKPFKKMKKIKNKSMVIFYEALIDSSD